MSEQKRNSHNDTLSDVEKFLLLLSELNIVDNDQKNAVDIDQTKNSQLSSVYPFPSLLDELPFLKDIPPSKSSFDDESETKKAEAQSVENLRNPNDRPSLQSGSLESLKTEETSEILAINLIQSLLLDGKQTPQEKPPEIPAQLSKFEAQTRNQDLYIETSSEDNDAIHMLQNILVVPELEELRNFKISVEQKLGLVESQVNNPALLNKIEGLENLLQNAASDLSSLGSKLTAIGDEQNSIPMEITNVKERIAQLENQVQDPQKLIQLLLPVIAELLSLKTLEAREEMCQAITPIIAEVILERSHLDNDSMSNAIADILPNAISTQIRNSPQEIAKALAPEVGAAIREQIRLDRDAIIDALAPEMGAAIKRQIVLERDSMVDALYPVIGNTIAKYFAEAIRSINQKVEQTFSLEGIQRKLRARIQGVSEAELILKESVPFEVKAIFLIHNLSGLVIIDIQQNDLDSLADPIDSDMLAGMLTAIRSFASECMSRSENTTELDAINYSGSKILLEVAGYCYLAVIIRGEPNLKFVNKIRHIFERIIQVYGDRFKEFDGDLSTVPTEAEIELKTLMQVAATKAEQKSSKTLIFIGLAILTLIFVPIAIYQYQSHRDRQLESRVLEAFANTPELAIYRLNVAVDRDNLKLLGKLPNQHLRDRAFQVAHETTNTEIAIAKINNSIYAVNIPPDPKLVAIEVQRLTKALNYTQGVNIQSQFNKGQVTITGQIAQPSIIPKITQAFINIAGITTVTNAAIITAPKLSTRIYFPINVTNLQPSDAEKLIEVQAFLDFYPDYNIKIFVKNDTIGDRAVNQQLGLKRAQSVREALLLRGINAKRLHISEIINTSTQQPSEQVSRWVEFQPILKSMSISN